jgi:hypothetical protein
MPDDRIRLHRQEVVVGWDRRHSWRRLPVVVEQGEVEIGAEGLLRRAAV